MLQQERKQAQLYNGHDHEDENSDNDDEEVPQREGEPEEWMLLCRLKASHKEASLMTTCSLTEQKLQEQCLLPY